MTTIVDPLTDPSALERVTGTGISASLLHRSDQSGAFDLIQRHAIASSSIDRHPGIERAVQRRSQALGMESAAYLRLIGDDALERLLLLGDVEPAAGRWCHPPRQTADLELRLIPLVAARQLATPRPLMRVWCAATGDGADAWSAALSLLRALPDAEMWEASVLATDQSFRALAHAQVGAYPAASVSILDRQAHALAFGSAAPHPSYLVSARMRSLVQFSHLDLRDEWPFSGPFDAIICRGVFSALPPDESQRLARRMVGVLRRGGTLYTGEDERIDTSSLRLIDREGGIHVA